MSKVQIKFGFDGVFRCYDVSFVSQYSFGFIPAKNKRMQDLRGLSYHIQVYVIENVVAGVPLEHFLKAIPAAAG
jgi:hypothetical protein